MQSKSKHRQRFGYSTIQEALEKFLSNVDDSKISLAVEIVSLEDAKDRVLAKDLASRIDLPPFKRAAMDGYAVLARDTKGASKKNPVLLDVIGSISAGEQTSFRVKSTKVVGIATGARMPKGADAVMMVEYTQRQNQKVKIFQEVESGKHVALKGEDVKKGQIVLQKGRWLTPQDVGIIAATGINKVHVFRKPRIAIFSTGSELVEPGSVNGAGCIFESNRRMISGMVTEYGADVVDLGICKDDRDAIKARLKKALVFDAVIVSGGSSVGEKDFVPEIINEMGKPGVVVHGIAMKPGSPTALGFVNGKPIIAVPGYPVSAFVAFYIFGRALLQKILKTLGPKEGRLMARITDEVKLHEGKYTFLRVKVINDNGSYLAEPISAAGASLLSTLAYSNGMVIIGNRNKLRKGEKVEVVLLGGIRENFIGGAE
jgi:molybdenum cofactor synthesis domain-containing protein